MKCLCFIISSVPGAADVSYAAQNYSTKYKYSGMVIARHHNMTVPGPASWGQHGTEQVNVESIWWFAPYTPECCCCLLFPSACLCCAVLEPKNHGKLQSRLTTRKINTFGKLFSEHLQKIVHAQFHALHGMFSAFGAPKFGSTYAALWQDLAFHPINQLLCGLETVPLRQVVESLSSQKFGWIFTDALYSMSQSFQCASTGCITGPRARFTTWNLLGFIILIHVPAHDPPCVKKTG